jgi:hypothetical protein
MGRQALPPLLQILPLCFTRFMVALCRHPRISPKEEHHVIFVPDSAGLCALFPYLHKLSWPPPLQLSCASRSQEPYLCWVVRMESGQALVSESL